jgi:peptidoglycan/LPS O-acetylase OafA/YrhL
VLAHDAVSYLRAGQAPTPVQHFWSLSVEEQFYLVWPLLFLVSGLVAVAIVTSNERRGAFGDFTRALGARRVMLGCATTALVLSLAWSIHDTSVNPASAYFVTTTRVWELAVGGILALLSKRVARRIGRVGVLAWAGLIMVVVSAFVLNGSSEFPGDVALLPVGGAALVIAAGSSWAKVSPARFTSHPVLVFIGDISYSLYLWHWPVIVLWKAESGGSIGFFGGLAILLISVLLAWLTTKYIEDRVRLAGFFAAHSGRSIATVTAVVVPVALASVYIAGEPSRFTGQLGASHPGAAVLAGTVAAPRTVPPVPPPAVAAEDLEVSANSRCAEVADSATPETCVFGDTSDPVRTVALVGDSFAGQWSTALDAIAREQRWKLVTVIKNGCPWTATTIEQAGSSEPFTTCHEWGEAALHELLTQIHPSVVITSDRTRDGTALGQPAGVASFAAIAHGMTTYWNTLIAHGIKVIAIRESPEMAQVIPDCLSSHGATVAGCSTPRATAIAINPPNVLAVKSMAGRVPLIDMNSLICGTTTCSPVVGNVVVYRDSHHLTSTYSRTLVPYLKQKLLATGDFSAG